MKRITEEMENALYESINRQVGIGKNYCRKFFSEMIKGANDILNKPTLSPAQEDAANTLASEIETTYTIGSISRSTIQWPVLIDWLSGKRLAPEGTVDCPKEATEEMVDAFESMGNKYGIKNAGKYERMVFKDGIQRTLDHINGAKNAK